jgi:hypothetical protein
MSLALAVLGTPKGFDSHVIGDPDLISSGLANKFEALRFSEIIGLQPGDTVWGLFKRVDAKGTVIGVCKLMGAWAYSSPRSGCYIGAGFILRNRLDNNDDLFIAIQDLMDAVVASAFAEKQFKFLSPKISDSLPNSIPESCRKLEGKLSDMLETAPYAKEGPVSPLYIRGERTKVLQKVLMEQDKFASLNIIFSDNHDFSQKAKSGGFQVIDVTDFEKWARMYNVQGQYSQSGQGDVYAPKSGGGEQPKSSGHGRQDGSSVSKTFINWLRSVNGWSNDIWILILLMSVLLTAVTSVLGTYIGVLEFRYWDNSTRVEKLSNEIKELQKSNEQLTNEVRGLIEKVDGTRKMSTPQSGQASESDRATTAPAPRPRTQPKRDSPAATPAQEGSAKDKKPDSSSPKQDGTNN